MSDRTLTGTQTEANLKQAFAGESQANRRYLYFAQMADIEGHPDIAHLFRSVAEGETGHAHRHLKFLNQDPATNLPIGTVQEALKAAQEGEIYEYTNMYPSMAETARAEGFIEIADWFESFLKEKPRHRCVKFLSTCCIKPFSKEVL